MNWDAHECIADGGGSCRWRWLADDAARATGGDDDAKDGSPWLG